jgi:FtsH-binding integral membrane protein
MFVRLRALPTTQLAGQLVAAVLLGGGGVCVAGYMLGLVVRFALFGVLWGLCWCLLAALMLLYSLMRRMRTGCQTSTFRASTPDAHRQRQHDREPAQPRLHDESTTHHSPRCFYKSVALCAVFLGCALNGILLLVLASRSSSTTTASPYLEEDAQLLRTLTFTVYATGFLLLLVFLCTRATQAAWMRSHGELYFLRGSHLPAYAWALLAGLSLGVTLGLIPTAPVSTSATPSTTSAMFLSRLEHRLPALMAGNALLATLTSLLSLLIREQARTQHSSSVYAPLALRSLSIDHAREPDHEEEEFTLYEGRLHYNQLCVLWCVCMYVC